MLIKNNKCVLYFETFCLYENPTVSWIWDTQHSNGQYTDDWILEIIVIVSHLSMKLIQETYIVYWGQFLFWYEWMMDRSIL